MAKPVYPDVLKKAGWDKQKGIIAKISKGETGVGAALEGLFVAYNAVPWDTIDETHTTVTLTQEALKHAFDHCKAVLGGQVEAARTKSFDVAKLAKQRSGEFKSPLLKASKDYLNKMAEASSNFATILRDSAMASLNHVGHTAESFHQHMAEVKQIGEHYVQNRKLALSQMRGMQTLFTEAKTRMTQEVTNAENAAKKAVSTPVTAQAQIIVIDGILGNCQSIQRVANDRFAKEGSVNNNPVQNAARQNIPKYKEAIYQPFLRVYQEQSSPDFNAIMAATAAIINTQKELDVLIGKVQNALSVATDAADTGEKSATDYANKVKLAITQALEQTNKLAEENRRLHEAAKRLPKIIETLKNPKAPLEQKKTAPNMAETTVGEIQRRMSTLTNTAAQVYNVQKRLLGMPQEMQQNTEVKAELTKLDKIVKQLEYAERMAVGLDTKAIQDQHTIMELMHTIG